MIQSLPFLRGVIKNKQRRDLWYFTHLTTTRSKGPKGKFAYGSADHRVYRVKDGWKCKDHVLPEETPVYDYGFPTYGEKMAVPHGYWIYKHQIPGVNLHCRSTVEEKIFSSKDRVYLGSETIDRSRKKKLRVRCGKGLYRIVLLNVKIKSNSCYIFGTNIRVDTRMRKIPDWMRRPTVVFPNPARTSRDEISNKFGFTLKIGRPKKAGPVKIAGIEMFCVKVSALCKIKFRNKIYYAHPSVVFPL